MALSLLSYDVTDLCLGKPPLRCLSASSSSVSDAIAALKSSEDPFLSVWNCSHGHDDDVADCECLGKISMADVICHLSKDEVHTLSALNSPVSVLLPTSRSIVLHVQPSCSLVEAFDLIIKGAQNLIVPIQTKTTTTTTKKRQQNDNVSVTNTTTTHSNGQRFCWITQEDIVRFLLGCIAAFSHLPAMSISDLGIINSSHAILAVDYNSPATVVVSAVSRALTDQTSVAVVDGEGDDDSSTYLIGEISPMTLTCCDETAAAAVATLSAGDLMEYLDGVNPPESLVQEVRDRLESKGLMGLLSLLDSSLSLSSSPTSGYSSEEESPARAFGRSMSMSTRMARKAEAVVCNPKSSLMAVMIQAITHRTNYTWVIDKDGCFAGMVTFVDILKVFRKFL